MGKFSLLIGAGVGYVLGTRAGRSQYDKIVAQTQKLWRDPRVQRTTQQARDTAGDLGHKAQDKVSAKVDEHVGSASDAARTDAAPSQADRTVTGGTTTGDSHG